MSQDDDDDKSRLERLQLALVQTQQAALQSGQRIVLVLEGRDSAGKDGSIKRITEYLSVRATRVVALPKPSDRERSQWYFQRYIEHLPGAGEFVIFNRSWYNRAGVEVVMGFSPPEAQAAFLRDAPDFERMLAESGIKLVKLWLDISKEEQGRRLDARRSDPLKALKVSDMDRVAQEKWSDYSDARDTMLTRTHTPIAPWYCVRADRKVPARRAIIQHILSEVAPAEILQDVAPPDPEILFPFELAALEDGRLAP
ncbi:polyphosphate kinase 2 [Erythrobacter sp. QSSC1-22B]|uniref:polyphosphate kinase 2 n=1 Tax=Erythrobacter sp. QSSC1-22B TaxID=1860125 RepID=UPI0008054384|nr:polyphosphate kinase 2 [Erythrobacter sp. QSSC1-22B]OBX18609.1 polyphosphate kinase 2 [Erythrobacter sp. QSSC1-22B]